MPAPAENPDSSTRAVLPRTDTLRNPRLVSAYGFVHEAPDRVLLEDVMASNPKIRYSNSTRAAGFAVRDPDYDPDGSNGWIETVDSMGQHLASMIATDYPDHSLVVRGIKVSINGDITLQSGTVVRDIEGIVDAGGDSSENWFNALRLSYDEHGKLSMASMAIINAVNIGELRSEAELTSSDRAASIFPAVAVYDAEQLEQQDGYSYEPLPGCQPLMAVYILDYPIR